MALTRFACGTGKTWLRKTLNAPFLKRSIPSAQLTRRRLNPHLRLRAYETLFHLNRGFTLIVMNLDRLERLALFQRDTLRAYRNMSEEVRALANTTLLATLRDTESQDAGRFQKLRLKWEQRPFPRVPKPKGSPKAAPKTLPTKRAGR